MLAPIARSFLISALLVSAGCAASPSSESNAVREAVVAERVEVEEERAGTTVVPSTPDVVEESEEAAMPDVVEESEEAAMPDVVEESEEPKLTDKDPTPVASSAERLERATQVARARPGALKTNGGLDEAVVWRIIQTRSKAIQQCYERELKRNPTIQGSLKIDFSVGPDGKVEKVTISESTIESQDLEECLVSRISKWVFPNPDSDQVTIITYPLSF